MASIAAAPVCKSLLVAASPERAFEVFTAQLDRWWPKSHGLGATPVRVSTIEPFVGGRWFTTFEDGSQAVVGHVLAWQPAERLVVTWEINARWEPDPRPAFCSEVEVRFVAAGTAHTRVELEHRHFERMGPQDGQTMRTAVDGGWPSILELYVQEVARAVP
jgi:uncharacterized protein YndB with AHSA1/START domain